MSALDDDAFLAALASCELPAADFNHLQHLRLAWLHLRHAPLDAAIARTCADIGRFGRHHGKVEAFHRTVTEALVRVMAGRGAAGLDWITFQQRHADLVADARAVLGRHYSPTLLASPEARLRFQPPDLLPLPA